MSFSPVPASRKCISPDGANTPGLTEADEGKAFSVKPQTNYLGSIDSGKSTKGATLSFVFDIAFAPANHLDIITA